MASEKNRPRRLLALETVSAIPAGPDDAIQTISVVDYDRGIAGHFLVVDIRYGGGHREHGFAAYWDGSWLKSRPPGIAIGLRHDADGDDGKALIDETLQIMIDEPANSSYPSFFVLIEGGGVQSEPFDVTVKR